MEKEPEALERRELEHKLSATGWGLFFIWIGTVFLIQAGTGQALIGIGIIILGMQGVRRYFGLRAERFWLLIGLVCLIGGIWEHLEAELPLVPIVLIVLGIALLFRAVSGRGGKRGGQ